MLEAGLTLGLSIVFASIGDILFSKGMRQSGEVHIAGFWDVPPLFKHVFTNRYILAGMLSMALNLAAYVAALEWVDVSVANPLTSLSYVLATFYAVAVIHEHVSRRRWIGVACITIGAICVGLSS